MKNYTNSNSNSNSNSNRITLSDSNIDKYAIIIIVLM